MVELFSNKLLGRGAFGKVNLALHVGTGRFVALKSFNKSKFNNDNSKEKVKAEWQMLRNLNHLNVLKMFEKFETSKYIIIVLEYVAAGDLLSYIKKRNKLTEKVAKYIFKQIIEGLEYIHSKDIIHRDIKLDNILIDLNNNVKICDFGISNIVTDNELMHEQCGTPAYMAPEVIRGKGYKGFASDVWSAGVVLYTMLSGVTPFRVNNMTELHAKIAQADYPKIEDISEEASYLIEGMLEVDPRKRLTISEILAFPWLESNNSNGKQKQKSSLITSGLVYGGRKSSAL